MLKIKDLFAFLELQSGMKLVDKDDDGNYIIEGNYHLLSSYNDVYLSKIFNILIKIPELYPNKLPEVSSIDNAVPIEFGHFYTNDSFCLGSPMELYLSALDEDISNYLIKHIDAYLYSATYYIKYNGQLPFGERSHGLIGIIEFWEEYLSTKDIRAIYNVLKYISLNKYRGHDLCPCGSGNKIRNCHGDKIFPIIKKSLDWVAKYEMHIFDKEVKEIIEQQQKTTSRY